MMLCEKCWLRVEMVEKYRGLMGSLQNLSVDQAEEKAGYLVYFVALLRYHFYAKGIYLPLTPGTIFKSVRRSRVAANVCGGSSDWLVAFSTTQKTMCSSHIAKISTDFFSSAPSRPVRRLLSIVPRGSDGGFSIHPLAKRSFLPTETTNPCLKMNFIS